MFAVISYGWHVCVPLAPFAFDGEIMVGWAHPTNVYTVVHFIVTMGLLSFQKYFPGNVVNKNMAERARRQKDDTRWLRTYFAFSPSLAI